MCSPALRPSSNRRVGLAISGKQEVASLLLLFFVIEYLPEMPVYFRRVYARYHFSFSKSIFIIVSNATLRWRLHTASSYWHHCTSGGRP
jgi:hypothetical protein